MLSEICLLEVYDRRSQALEHGRVGFAQQAQAFAEVPAHQVQVARQVLNGVALLVYRKVLVPGMAVDKAHVVAVGGGEAPSAAAGFGGKEDLYPVLFLYLDSLLLYQFLHSLCLFMCQRYRGTAHYFCAG